MIRVWYEGKGLDGDRERSYPNHLKLLRALGGITKRSQEGGGSKFGKFVLLGKESFMNYA